MKTCYSSSQKILLFIFAIFFLFGSKCKNDSSLVDEQPIQKYYTKIIFNSDDTMKYDHIRNENVITTGQTINREVILEILKDDGVYFEPYVNGSLSGSGFLVTLLDDYIIIDSLSIGPYSNRNIQCSHDVNQIDLRGKIRHNDVFSGHQVFENFSNSSSGRLGGFHMVLGVNYSPIEQKCSSEFDIQVRDRSNPTLKFTLMNILDDTEIHVVLNDRPVKETQSTN